MKKRIFSKRLSKCLLSCMLIFTMALVINCKKTTEPNKVPIPADFVYIHGGTFNNGTSNVTVSSFYIDKYELTQTEYSTVMGGNPSQHPNVNLGPVEQVSWFNAVEYCNRRSMIDGLTPCYSYTTYGTNPSIWPVGWYSNPTNHINISCNWNAHGYRLLSEAEWEFAARGGINSHSYLYSGSDDIDAVAWYGLEHGTTHTVGSKMANELGLFDMSGNVWEWVWDIYGDYPSGVQTNPHGAVGGSFRVKRGGSYSSVENDCRVDGHRVDVSATAIGDRDGFRICRIAP